MNRIEKKEEEEEEKGKNIFTSHVNCLEETSHHEVTHGMWHMLLLKDCGIGQIEQRRNKSRIMHCSTFHHEYQVTRPKT